MLRPAMLTLPSVVVSSRIKSLINVDFPQPVGPTRKTNSPRSIAKEMRSRAICPPG